MGKTSKITQWYSVINNTNYNFVYEKKKGKHTLTINDVPHVIKAGFISTMIGFDEKFTFDGVDARLVIEKKIPDVVINNTFLQSGKHYVERPRWSMIFVIICVLIPIVSLGGALPALLGFGGASMCVNVSKKDKPTAVKIILCIVITFLVWLPLLFSFYLATLNNL